MAEEIAFSIAEQVITKLGSLAFQEIELISGAKDDMKKLENSLSTIKAVLIDAEEKQEKSLAVKSWLRRLQGIVYEADELVDEVATKDLQRMVQAQSRGKVATQKMEDLSMLVSSSSSAGSSQQVAYAEETSSCGVDYGEQAYVGREKDKEKMIESLLNPTGSQGNVSVNAIVGIGGLGKTALAQLVYNDEKVKNYFERKMWQCVSEEFDLKLLVKKILECGTNNEVPNLLGLEQLHIRLKENLEGKRYLLVLDDVWNEDQKKWDDLKAYLLMGAPGSKILFTTRSTRVALVMGVDSPYVLQGLSLDYNLFHGLVPASLGNLQNLTGVNLSGNQLNGTLPDSFGQLSQLSALDVSLYNLIDVDLSSNFLEGPTPLSTFEIELLELSNNRFSGPIPEKLAQSMPNLVFLSLSGNQLTGDIPVSIGAMVSLVVLNLSDLRILSLRSNAFFGEIPSTLSNLSSLQVLDLAKNNLAGSIPVTFGDFKAMSLEQYINEYLPYGK
ncbi:hypothetical protein GH714_029843 [Hevea brasiliensis]|uniref:Rx N-terminal domain-containing protein n=1 Tax=Hevea brasiliensis TaxID=3981 RepID=A0A6A6N5F2_HEVBR|nr:hypothetical protein GH714_029843 [Hevea brasiliensis]